ncbi:MAG: polysaccharide biosynthesis/export family protein [Acidobacteriaceae bacterium]|nr:polysaccharide biosynthesis/export family protein [Acidobacteriaceae bacterium]
MKFDTRRLITALFVPVVALCASQEHQLSQKPSVSVSKYAAGDIDADYELGPGDRIALHVPDLEEEIGNEPYLINLAGDLDVPLVGRVHAAGLTVDKLQTQIMAQLKGNLRNPTVAVFIAEFGSQPVSVLGAVTSPGVRQIRGRKTLFEVLSEAGGLRNDAGNTIKITRRKEWGPIPLPNATADTSGDFTIAEISARSVVQASNPQENILVRPHDVISVPQAEMIYVIGAVKRSGGFVLNERDHISVLQALSMAQGLERTAASSQAKILRTQKGLTTPIEIPINVKQILSGKASDVALNVNDILFVPNSAAKSAALRGTEAAIQISTGVAIWR